MSPTRSYTAKAQTGKIVLVFYFEPGCKECACNCNISFFLISFQTPGVHKHKNEGTRMKYVWINTQINCEVESPCC